MTPAEQGIRIRVNATTIGLILALLGNGFALIWGAATLSSTVESIQSTVVKLDGTLNAVGNSVQNLRERLGVLEDRNLRDRVGDLEDRNLQHPEPTPLTPLRGRP